MNKPYSIFVSHHHTDAAALGAIKHKFTPMGIRLFLAHDDINPGDHSLVTMEGEIRKCDMFWYVGGKEANESVFCQQEFGMALGLKKKIVLTALKSFPPKGFFGDIQVIMFDDIDEKLFFEILLQPTEETNKHLKILDIEGFSLVEQENRIYMEENNWNDHTYVTTFNMVIYRDNVKVQCEVKIGYKGQKTWDHTSALLPTTFAHLRNPFFSRVRTYNNEDKLTQEEINSLLYLLNDTVFMPEDELKLIADEGVFQKSLYRSEYGNR